MTLEDGIHKVDKVKSISSIKGRQACYVKGRCFHTDIDVVGKGDKVVVKDGKVDAMIEPVPGAEDLI